jgi:hypothetical protein
LNLGGTVSISSLDASASPNTVNYNGTGAQSVAGPSYYNLNLSGGNTKTLASTTGVGGDLHVLSPARANFNATVTVAGTTTVDAGATLSGSGTLNGTVVANGTVSPGVVIGILTLGNTPTLNGTNLMQLNRTNSPSSDRLTISGQQVAYGGALTVQNLGPALVAGDSFQIFSASSYSGTFTSITLPTLGANLAWTNTLSSNGAIAVISTGPGVRPRLTNSVSGGSLVLSWDTVGSPGYALQAQTNSGGLGTNWSVVPGGTTSPFVVPIDRANRSVFFRLYRP